MLKQAKIKIEETKEFNNDSVVNLYKLNKWSSAEKPDLLVNALRNSDSLILAYYDDKLIGLGNAISDGFLVVYYPHLLIHPNFHRLGTGKMIMEKFQEKYGAFHQQMLTSDIDAIGFYKKCGFDRAGKTEPMWIYKGNDH